MARIYIQVLINDVSGFSSDTLINIIIIITAYAETTLNMKTNCSKHVGAVNIIIINFCALLKVVAGDNLVGILNKTANKF